MSTLWGRLPKGAATGGVRRQISIAALAVVLGASTAGVGTVAAAPGAQRYADHPYEIKVLGHRPDGSPKLTSTSPSGLSPSAVQSAYNLSGLGPSSGAGGGQIIAIVDAFHDPHALSDLNAFDAQYGYPTLTPCTSLSQTGPCFEQADPNGTPKVNSSWVLEESLDIEWAHAEAPGAKVVLVEAASNSFSNLFRAIQYANSIGATEVSMSWGGGEFSGETSDDAYFTHPGTYYTASSGDGGHGTIYPSASPNVIAVGGTTLNGCSGTSCSFTGETAWSGSGGGASSDEPLPSYQGSYAGLVSDATSITALTGGRRGVPDVSFEGNPNTGVSVYDSTAYQGQSGWWTLGGTSVGAPNWAGILAAATAAAKAALQGDANIYGVGYTTNLRDIVSGINGNCGTDCSAGTGYDLVTGLGSPLNYP